MHLKSNILTRKLELFGELPPDDRRLLDDVIRTKRKVPARTSIIREGEAPTDVHLVIEGIACRSKTLPEGRRQILAFLVPGDFCDLNVFILNAMDHDIETLSPCTMVEIPRQRVIEMTERPSLVRALWWCTLVDEGTLREWIVNIGQRDAERRVAHLLCEIHRRLQTIGLAHQGCFDFPVTQYELADTAGISAVHMNRVIQSLRGLHLLEMKGSRVTILDLKGLVALAGFKPNYLHLDGGKRDNR